MYIYCNSTLCTFLFLEAAFNLRLDPAQNEDLEVTKCTQEIRAFRKMTLFELKIATWK